MAQTIYTNEIAEETTRTALISASKGAIRAFILREAKSPWEEKIRLHRNWDYVEAELHVWKSPEFLAAGINRLALFVLDSLDPGFAFDMDAMVALKVDPKIRRAHNHIWSIYVDSRIEKMGLKSFFDKSLRRNLFLESQRGHPWSISNRVFDELWRKEKFTHPEIIDRAKGLDEMLREGRGRLDSDAFEVEMSHYRGNCSAGDCVKAIQSPELKEAATILLSFVADTCYGSVVDPCSYGIRFAHNGIVFAELVTTKKDRLLLTVFDFLSENRITHVFLGKDGDVMPIAQREIKNIYDAITLNA